MQQNTCQAAHAAVQSLPALSARVVPPASVGCRAGSAGGKCIHWVRAEGTGGCTQDTHQSCSMAQGLGISGILRRDTASRAAKPEEPLPSVENELAVKYRELRKAWEATSHG